MGCKEMSHFNLDSLKKNCKGIKATDEAVKVIVRRKQNSQRYYKMSKSTLDIETTQILALTRNRRKREKKFSDSFMCSYIEQILHALQKGRFLIDLNFVKSNLSTA